MENKQYPKVKKRFGIGMVPILMTLVGIILAVCLIYEMMQ
jgi:hypothetical protein